MRIDQTRELACDEIAAESLSTSTQYARSLLSIAQSMAANLRPATVGYALGLFDTDTLEDRIMNILAKSNRIRRTRARASTLATLVLLLVTGLGVSGFSIQVAQPAKANGDLQQFVGTWQAKFKGKIFQTIKLEKKQGKLTAEAKVTSGLLRITEEDAIQFEMKITGANQAQIQIVIPPAEADQVPKPKPWMLERSKSGQ